MTRFTTLPEIIQHIRGKFPQMVFVGKDYSIANLIADLEGINARMQDLEHDLLVGPAAIAEIFPVKMEKGE